MLVGRNQKRSGVSSKQNRTAPTLKNVRPSDLWDVGRLKVLFEQQTWIEKTLPNFQFFVTAAVKSRSAGKKPGSLFVWLIRENKKDFVSQDHEDTALKAIAEYRSNSNAVTFNEGASSVLKDTGDDMDPKVVAATRRLARMELEKLGAKYAA